MVICSLFFFDCDYKIGGVVNYLSTATVAGNVIFK